VPCHRDIGRKVRKNMRLNQQFMLPNEQFDLPIIEWFNKQRDRLGLESELCACRKIARAQEIEQCGFDETGLRSRSTCNIWVRIRNENGVVEVAHLGCFKHLIGGTAEEVAAHVELQFQRANEQIDALRAELVKWAHDPDLLAPKVDGGVMLHKIKSLMHDTCHTANLSAIIVIERAALSGEEFFDKAVWDAMPESRKKILDFLCGNHTRGLPVDAFCRLHDAYIVKNLGSDLEAAGAGGCPRLEIGEVSSLLYLQLYTFVGHGDYAKSDGPAFMCMLNEKFSDLAGLTTGASACGKRQDWILEVSSIVHLLVPAVLEQTNGRRTLDPNILADSILIRTQTRP